MSDKILLIVIISFGILGLAGLFIVFILDTIRQIKIAPIRKLSKENESKWLDYFNSTDFIWGVALENIEKDDRVIIYKGDVYKVKDVKEAKKKHEELGKQ